MLNFHFMTVRYAPRLAVVACCLCLTGATASAGVISASSNGYGISADLNVTLLNSVLIDVGLGPVPMAAGVAPAAYSETDSLLEAHATGVLGLPLLGLTDIIRLDTGLLEVAAQSDVDGGAGARTASAMATVNNANALVVNVGALLGLSNFLSLDATQVQSNASVSGDFGAFSPTGGTTITGTHGISGNQARLVVLGTEFLLDAAPAPNTVITIDSSLGGSLASLVGSVDVILNEQVLAGDFLSSGMMTVNAIHLDFHGLAVGLGSTTGLLNGEIIISHSDASLAAVEDAGPEPVPEPGSLSMLTLGMMCVGGLRWRRRIIRATTLVA